MFKSLREASDRAKTLETEIGGVREELATAQTELGTVQAELATAQTELGTVQAELDTAKAELDTAQTELATAQTELATARGEHPTIEARITSEVTTKAEAKVLELSASRGLPPIPESGKGSAGGEEEPEIPENATPRERLAISFQKQFAKKTA